MASAGRERIIERVLGGCALLCILVMIAVVGVLLVQSVGFFSEAPASIGSAASASSAVVEDPRRVLSDLIAGTMIIAAIAGAVAVPAGVLSAIYLAELAEPDRKHRLRLGLDLLAAIPTVVYGYLALVMVAPMLQLVPRLQHHPAASAGLVLGLLITPLVSGLAQGAIESVPTSLREASYALGADRLRTTIWIVLPTAARSIGAAVLLAISRAAGETMIVAIALGRHPEASDAVATMTTYMVDAGLHAPAFGSSSYHSLFVVGAVLFGLTSLANLTARWISRTGGRA